MTAAGRGAHARRLAALEARLAPPAPDPRTCPACGQIPLHWRVVGGPTCPVCGSEYMAVHRGRILFGAAARAALSARRAAGTP